MHFWLWLKHAWDRSSGLRRLLMWTVAGWWLALCIDEWDMPFIYIWPRLLADIHIFFLLGVIGVCLIVARHHERSLESDVDLLLGLGSGQSIFLTMLGVERFHWFIGGLTAAIMAALILMPARLFHHLTTSKNIPFEV